MAIKVVHVVGARPNFMKVAPIIRALEAYHEFEQLLVHTGQHYDAQMSQIFFAQLNIPAPDIHLNVGSGSHAVQTAQVMIAFEQVLLEYKPDVVLVVGDVNSTLACTLTAVKLQIPVVHVEAGLRSYNRAMPEEINRIVTDAFSALLFTTERSAADNLHREGIEPDRIHFVGNVMIDTLLANLHQAQQLEILPQFNLLPQKYALLTLHRPANVDDPKAFAALLRTLGQVSQEIPILFPCHPRTRKRIEEFNLAPLLSEYPQIQVCEPLGYLPFLHVMANARLVFTDSGGIQEETTALGIPCLTLREETERPITVTEGSNVIVGTDADYIHQEVQSILSGKGKDGRIPDKWDGHAAQRIASTLFETYL